MEEVITCVCGEQNRWTIYENKIECGTCSRVFLLHKVPIRQINVRKINRYLDKLKNRR